MHQSCLNSVLWSEACKIAILEIFHSPRAVIVLELKTGKTM